MPQTHMSDTLFDAIVEYRTKRLRRSLSKGAQAPRSIEAARDYFTGEASTIRSAAAHHGLSATMVSKMIQSLSAAYEEMKANEGLVEVKLVVPKAQAQEVCAYGDRVLQAVRGGVDTPSLVGELEIMKCQLRAASRVSPELAWRLRDTISLCQRAHCHDIDIQRSLSEILEGAAELVCRGEAQEG
tara:strand:- start:2009 stop:2563 length:555 start_codon:yes stop_codon:yes gene_type:complete